jgi:RNA polymerase sigma-70 factor, ECF subfamily
MALPGIADLRLDDGFDAWMVREQRRIYLLCLRLLRDADEADTATQDTFLRAHASLHREGTDLVRSPEHWLTRIAVNQCFDRMRSRSWKFWRRRVREEDERAVLQLARAESLAPDRAILAQEIAVRITRSVRRMSPRQQAVFLLRHEEDRSLEEIGDLLGLDIGTVKSHLSRALAKLRCDLRELYEKRTFE